MARFNEILVGRYNRYVQKLMSMKGGASVATISDEVMPILQFFHGVENRYLEGWDRFGLLVFQAGAAASNAVWRFRNPPGSNLIAVVELLAYTNRNAAADDITIQQATAGVDLGTVNTTYGQFDARGRTNPTCVISNANNGAQIGNVIAENFVAVNQNVSFIPTDDTEIVVLPGRSIELRDAVQNQAITVTTWWRERFLEESERQ